VYAYGLPILPTEAVHLFSVEGSVTTIRTHKDKQHFMLSSTSGHVYVYEQKGDGEFERKLSGLLHAPGESCDKFGSLRTLLLT
jgi:hypothetical protein